MILGPADKLRPWALAFIFFAGTAGAGALTVTDNPLDDQLLQAVSYSQNEERIGDLLAQGANPDAQLLWNTSYGQSGESIWLVALGRSSPAVVALLKEHRPKARPIPPADQARAFARAIRTNQAGNQEYAKQRIQLMLDNGLDINALDLEDLSRKAHTANDGLSPLMMAVRTDRMELVKFLLHKGADPKLATRDGENALFLSHSGQMTALLLEAGADAGAVGKHGRTALEAAIFEGRADVVSTLLDKGGDLIRQKAGEALLLACRIMIQTTAPRAAQNSPAIIKLLLAHGIDPNMKLQHSRWTDTPLMEAVRANNGAGVKLLLDAGADPKVGYGKGSLLELAVEKDPEILRQLIGHCGPLLAEAREKLAAAFLRHGNPANLAVLNAYGIKITGVKQGGVDASVTGLVDAVAQGHMEMVEALLGQGVDINASGYNQSPLTAAVQYNNKTFAEFLIGRGADVNKTDRTGMTPLGAAVGQANVEIYRFLKSSKANPVSKDPAHAYLLMAVNGLLFDPVYDKPNGSLDILKDLLDAGNPVDQTDSQGMTALWVLAAGQPRDDAARQRVSQAARLLLDRGAAVDWVPPNCGKFLLSTNSAEAGASVMDARQQAEILCRTPLSRAAESDNLIAAQIFLAAGAAVNWQSSSDGQTPLMAAAYFGDPGMVSMLLEHGAKPDLRDKNNQTAADIARTQSNTKVYAILKAAAQTGASH